MAALRMEVRPFLRLVNAGGRKGLGCPAWEFQAGSGRGVVALSGMGAEAALLAARRLLARCRPEVLISLGFGGSLSPELVPGALVLGQSFWHYDAEKGFLVTVPAPAPPRPLGGMLQQLAAAGLPAFTGSMVTTSSIIHKARQGAQIRRLVRPVLDLETSALAETAAAQGLAFLGLRAITDAAAEEIPDFLVQGLRPEVQKDSRAALAWLAADPRRVVPLWHLWRRGRQGAELLARALAVILPLL